MKSQLWVNHAKIIKSPDDPIVGGESGPKHRPIKEEWVTDLRDACLSTDGALEASFPLNDANNPEVEIGEAIVHHHTAFFFKQWGGAKSTSGGRELGGRTWDEFPTFVPEGSLL